MARFPTDEELLDWIRRNPGNANQRQLAQEFGLKGSQRAELRRRLAKLRDAGVLKRGRRATRAGSLPPTTVLRVTEVDDDATVFATPTSWAGTDDPPRVEVATKRGLTLGPGDHVLAHVEETDDGHRARPIHRIERSERRMLGVFRAGTTGGRVEPVEKRASREWTVPRGETHGAEDGELVEVEQIGAARFGLPRGRVVARHGDPMSAGQVSLIAMVQHGIPLSFPDEVLEEVAKAGPVTEESLRGPHPREDLRDLPLITIDPSDARDHDDAICAMADTDPKNPGGHIVWVAIADVAHYVRTGSVIDREARERGNSTYFPDRVSPMLPEELSADLCSLVAGEDRPCLAVRMVLDQDGSKRGHRFTRALMRSPASLDYDEVQAAMDGATTGLEPEMVETVLRPLYAAWHAAMEARSRRQPLELDLPERRIELTPDGQVRAIAFRDRLDAHRVIEEFMILANVAAAEALEAARSPVVYRVHEEPNPDRLDALRETVESVGLRLAKGQVLRTAHFNDLLASARGREGAEAISMSVLRAMQQAYYSPANLGHFGLNLPRYAHFTSPIRRYSDLIVHRALISALDLGTDGLTRGEIERLERTSHHISQTERRSMEAERDTVDRYVALYMADREGGEFEGVIAGIARAGLFVRLDETGADGLVPIRTLGSDYFRHDAESQTLTGERTGRVFGLGLRVSVRLLEASPVTGGLIFELLSVEGNTVERGQRRGRGKSPKTAFRAKARANEKARQRKAAKAGRRARKR